MPPVTLLYRFPSSGQASDALLAIDGYLTDDGVEDFGTEVDGGVVAVTVGSEQELIAEDALHAWAAEHHGEAFG